MSHPVLIDENYSKFRKFLLQNIDAFFDYRLQNPHWRINLNLNKKFEQILIENFID